VKQPFLPEYLADCSLHPGASIAGDAPLTVATPVAQWAYALTCRLKPHLVDDNGVLKESLRFVFDMEVVRGRIGVGWTTPDGASFFIERSTSRRDCRISFLLQTGEKVGHLVFRNVDPSGERSEFILTRARAEPLRDGERRYPVSITARQVVDEPNPHDGGTLTVFDTDAALAINSARVGWLRAAGLPINGTRVLDAGCGIGHFVPFYASLGCAVTAVDGRAENIAELRRRYPHVDARVADAERLNPRELGEFDVIHCFGLLYHLESPVAALRCLSSMCRQLLILETMVCDSSKPVSILVDETKAASQALAGLGSRPSPAFITLALNRVGFDYVYEAATPPAHPDFQFEWQDNLDTTRNGVPLRCMMVASRAPLELPSLVPLLES
jgi:2-polyprenyl-3-methyl-5-hydroxy-6-metoxy-1,4-benzoquinol methylase